jgi:hypothetical protein
MNNNMRRHWHLVQAFPLNPRQPLRPRLLLLLLGKPVLVRVVQALDVRLGTALAPRLLLLRHLGPLIDLESLALELIVDMRVNDVATLIIAVIRVVAWLILARRIHGLVRFAIAATLLRFRTFSLFFSLQFFFEMFINEMFINIMLWGIRKLSLFLVKSSLNESTTIFNSLNKNIHFITVLK